MNDDWAYARSVSDLLNWDYRIPQWAQASALSHIAWGSLFAVLFGATFTVLSVATLVMSVFCIILFYALYRQLGVAPSFALLGTAALGFNPIFFSLSFSFMTDITFLGFLSAGCLCYVHGVKHNMVLWLWVGSLATSLAYLTRQFGIVLVVAVLLFLFWSRRITWRRALAVSIVPAIVLVVYMLWESMQPSQLISIYLMERRQDALANPAGYIWDRMLALASTVTSIGVFIFPVLITPKRPLLAVLLFGGVVLLHVGNLQTSGTVLPLNGNILSNVGIFACCRLSPVLNEAVWLILAMFSAATVAFYAIWCFSRLRQRLKTRSRKDRGDDPALILYIFGAITGLITLIAAPFLFDRYWLPLVPVALLPALRFLSRDGTHFAEPSDVGLSTSASGHRLPAWRWAAVVLLGLFSVAAQKDYMTRASIRWQLAESLTSQGIPPKRIYAGFEWSGWFLYDEGERKVRASGNYTDIVFPPDLVLDPEYAIIEIGQDGFELVESVPYHSWLSFGTTLSMGVYMRR